MPNTSDSIPAEQLTLVQKRIIRAPRERVFQAWIDSDLRRQWWLSGDTRKPPHVCEIDARVGGKYKLCMTYKDFEWIMEGTFLELVEPERLVFTWTINNLEEPVCDNRVTVELFDVAGSTDIVLTHEGSPSPKVRDQHQGNWSNCFKDLAAALE